MPVECRDELLGPGEEVDERRRNAQHETVKAVGQPDSPGIPGQFPVVAVDQVLDGFEQSRFAHVAREVGLIADQGHVQGELLGIQQAEFLDPGFEGEDNRSEIQI